MLEDNSQVPCTNNLPSEQLTCPDINGANTNTSTNKKKRRPAGTPGIYMYIYSSPKYAYIYICTDMYV